MAKIPFNIKYRPQIEAGEYKVETRDGRSVRIICWDMDNYNPIIALVSNRQNHNGSLREHIFSYGTDGLYIAMCESKVDLFIVTPEEEMTEFEIRLLDWLSSDTSGEIPMERMKEVVRNRGAELLAIARKELEPEVLQRLEEAYKNQDDVVYEYGKRDGKAEALKDLPRWKKTTNRGSYVDASNLLFHDGHYLGIKDLEKLPGFKEDKE